MELQASQAEVGGGIRQESNIILAVWASLEFNASKDEKMCAIQEVKEVVISLLLHCQSLSASRPIVLKQGGTVC